MNDFINYLEGWQQDQEIHTQLWKGIKNDWLNPQVGKQLYLDEKEDVLAVQIGNEVALVGFLYFNKSFFNIPNWQRAFAYKAYQFIKQQLETLNSEKGWKAKLILITNYRLSGCGKQNISELPYNVGYFYLVDSITEVNPTYQLQVDKQMQDYKEGDILLNEMFQIDQQRRNMNKRWSCSICDGNNETGCLYFDPTECPKFK